jgi:hypothetical protein
VLKKSGMHGYKHPVLLQVIGWAVVVAMAWMGVLTVTENLHKL